MSISPAMANRHCEGLNVSVVDSFVSGTLKVGGTPTNVILSNSAVSLRRLLVNTIAVERIVYTNSSFHIGNTTTTLDLTFSNYNFQESALLLETLVFQRLLQFETGTFLASTVTMFDLLGSRVGSTAVQASSSQTVAAASSAKNSKFDIQRIVLASSLFQFFIPMERVDFALTDSLLKGGLRFNSADATENSVGTSPIYDSRIRLVNVTVSAQLAFKANLVRNTSLEIESSVILRDLFIGGVHVGNTISLINIQFVATTNNILFPASLPQRKLDGCVITIQSCNFTSDVDNIFVNSPMYAVAGPSHLLVANNTFYRRLNSNQAGVRIEGNADDVFVLNPSFGGPQLVIANNSFASQTDAAAVFQGVLSNAYVLVWDESNVWSNPMQFLMTSPSSRQYPAQFNIQMTGQRNFTRLGIGNTGSADSFHSSSLVLTDVTFQKSIGIYTADFIALGSCVGCTVLLRDVIMHKPLRFFLRNASEVLVTVHNATSPSQTGALEFKEYGPSTMSCQTCTVSIVENTLGTVDFQSNVVFGQSGVQIENARLNYLLIAAAFVNSTVAVRDISANTIWCSGASSTVSSFNASVVIVRVVSTVFAFGNFFNFSGVEIIDCEVGTGTLTIAPERFDYSTMVIEGLRSAGPATVGAKLEMRYSSLHIRDAVLTGGYLEIGLPNNKVTASNISFEKFTVPSFTIHGSYNLTSSLHFFNGVVNGWRNSGFSAFEGSSVLAISAVVFTGEVDAHQAVMNNGGSATLLNVSARPTAAAAVLPVVKMGSSLYVAESLFNGLSLQAVESGSNVTIFNCTLTPSTTNAITITQAYSPSSLPLPDVYVASTLLISSNNVTFVGTQTGTLGFIASPNNVFGNAVKHLIIIARSNSLTTQLTPPTIRRFAVALYNFGGFLDWDTSNTWNWPIAFYVSTLNIVPHPDQIDIVDGFNIVIRDQPLLTFHIVNYQETSNVASTIAAQTFGFIARVELDTVPITGTDGRDGVRVYLPARGCAHDCQMIFRNVSYQSESADPQFIAVAGGIWAGATKGQDAIVIENCSLFTLVIGGGQMTSSPCHACSTRFSNVRLSPSSKIPMQPQLVITGYFSSGAAVAVDSQDIIFSPQALNPIRIQSGGFSNFSRLDLRALSISGVVLTSTFFQNDSTFVLEDSVIFHPSTSSHYAALSLSPLLRNRSQFIVRRNNVTGSRTHVVELLPYSEPEARDTDLADLSRIVFEKNQFISAVSAASHIVSVTSGPAPSANAFLPKGTNMYVLNNGFMSVSAVDAQLQSHVFGMLSSGGALIFDTSNYGNASGGFVLHQIRTGAPHEISINGSLSALHSIQISPQLPSADDAVSDWQDLSIRIGGFGLFAMPQYPAVSLSIVMPNCTRCNVEVDSVDFTGGSGTTIDAPKSSPSPTVGPRVEANLVITAFQLKSSNISISRVIANSATISTLLPMMDSNLTIKRCRFVSTLNDTIALLVNSSAGRGSRQRIAECLVANTARAGFSHGTFGALVFPSPHASVRDGGRVTLGENVLGTNCINATLLEIGIASGGYFDHKETNRVIDGGAVGKVNVVIEERSAENAEDDLPMDEDEPTAMTKTVTRTMTKTRTLYNDGSSRRFQVASALSAGDSSGVSRQNISFFISFRAFAGVDASRAITFAVINRGMESETSSGLPMSLVNAALVFSHILHAAVETVNGIVGRNVSLSVSDSDVARIHLVTGDCVLCSVTARNVTVVESISLVGAVNTTFSRSSITIVNINVTNASSSASTTASGVFIKPFTVSDSVVTVASIAISNGNFTFGVLCDVTDWNVTEANRGGLVSSILLIEGVSLTNGSVNALSGASFNTSVAVKNVSATYTIQVSCTPLVASLFDVRGLSIRTLSAANNQSSQSTTNGTGSIIASFDQVYGSHVVVANSTVSSVGGAVVITASIVGGGSTLFAREIVILDGSLSMQAESQCSAAEPCSVGLANCSVTALTNTQLAAVIVISGAVGDNTALLILENSVTSEVVGGILLTGSHNGDGNSLVLSGNVIEAQGAAFSTLEGISFTGAVNVSKNTFLAGNCTLNLTEVVSVVNIAGNSLADESQTLAITGEEPLVPGSRVSYGNERAGEAMPVDSPGFEEIVETIATSTTAPAEPIETGTTITLPPIPTRATPIQTARPLSTEGFGYRFLEHTPVLFSGVKGKIPLVFSNDFVSAETSIGQGRRFGTAAYSVTPDNGDAPSNGTKANRAAFSAAAAGTTWYVRRFLVTEKDDSVIRIATTTSLNSGASDRSMLSIARTGLGGSTDSVVLNNQALGGSFAGSAAYSSSSCGTLLSSSKDKPSRGEWRLAITDERMLEPVCKSNARLAGIAYSTAPFTSQPTLSYAFIVAGEAIEDLALFVSDAWRGAEDASSFVSAGGQTESLLIGDVSNPSNVKDGIPIRKSGIGLVRLTDASHRIRIAATTHNAVACTVGDQRSYRGIFVHKNVPLVDGGIATECYMFDTVVDLHVACAKSEECVGFSTVQMAESATSTTPIELPLCLYTAGSMELDQMPYPRMYFMKPKASASSPVECEVDVEQRGEVAVFVQQTSLASNSIVVKVDAVGVATCGGKYPFANRFMGGSGRCGQWALCAVTNVPLNAKVTVAPSTAAGLVQGGCENSFGVIVMQTSVDPDQSPPTPEPTARRLDRTTNPNIIPRNVAQSSTTIHDDAIKLFVFKASDAALGVAQTIYAPKAGFVVPRISMSTPSSCQYCGGEVGFIDGWMATLSQRPEKTLFCADPMTLLPSTANSDCVINGKSGPAAAQSFTGTVSISLNRTDAPEIESDAYLGLIATVSMLKATNDRRPTDPPLFPLLSTTGAPMTLVGLASDEKSSATNLPFHTTATKLFTVGTVGSLIDAYYVPMFENPLGGGEGGTRVQNSLFTTSSQVCVVDHSKGLAAQCTFYIPKGATHVVIKAAQTDFATKAMRVRILSDGITVSSTTTCGGKGRNLFQDEIGRQERCDLYRVCNSRFIYADDAMATNNDRGLVLIDLPAGLRSYSCDYTAVIIAEFTRPNVEPVTCGGETPFECEGERRCLPMDFVCDGIQDCTSGRDEMLCTGAAQLQDEGFCVGATQQSVVDTRSLATCTRSGVAAQTSIYSFDGHRCVVIDAEAAATIASNPAPFLCNRMKGTVTYLLLGDTTSFGLCRSAVQCNGHGEAALDTNGQCRCTCNEGFIGEWCENSLKLEEITQIACILEGTTAINLAIVGEALRLNLPYIQVTCTDLAGDGTNLTRVMCYASSKRKFPTDPPAHYRRLLNPASWPTVRATLATFEGHPQLHMITGRTVLTPETSTVKCDGSAGNYDCPVNTAHDRVRVIIRGNVPATSASVVTSVNRRSETIACIPVSVEDTGGCFVSSCDFASAGPEGTTVTISDVAYSPANDLTTACASSGISIAAQVSLGNVDTQTADAVMNVETNFISFMAGGIVLFIVGALACWVVAIVFGVLWRLQVRAALAQHVYDDGTLSRYHQKQAELLVRLRLFLDLKNQTSFVRSLRKDRWASAFGVLGLVCAVCASFLIVYYDTSYEMTSNFSVLYEEYADSQCDGSSTGYMPRRIFAIPPGTTSCERAQSTGESVGVSFAAGSCMGGDGSYHVTLRLGGSKAACITAEEMRFPSGVCVPLKSVDPTAVREVYVRLTCSSYSRIAERVGELRRITGASDVFVSGEVIAPGARLAPRLSEDKTHFVYPYAVGLGLRASSSYTASVISSMATDASFDNNFESLRIVLQRPNCTFSNDLSTTGIACLRDLETALLPSMATLSSSSAAPTLAIHSPSVADVPLGNIFGGFGTALPETWVSSGPTAHKYYHIAGSDFDMGAKFSNKASQRSEGDGYTVSLWLRADTSSLGFAYAVTDAFENAYRMTVETLDRLAAIIDSGASPIQWFSDPANYNVYHGLYVNGPGKSLYFVHATSQGGKDGDGDEGTPRIVQLEFDLEAIGAQRVMNGQWHHIAISFIVEPSATVRAQLIVDGESSYTKVGWSACVDSLPPPIQTLETPVPVFSTIENRVTSGGLLVVGYFNGGVYGLQAHTRPMLDSDFLPTLTNTIRDANTFPRKDTLILGSFLMAFALTLLIILILGSVRDIRGMSNSMAEAEYVDLARRYYVLMVNVLKDYDAKTLSAAVNTDSPSFAGALSTMAASGRQRRRSVAGGNSSGDRSTPPPPPRRLIRFQTALRWSGLSLTEMTTMLREVEGQSRSPALTLLYVLYREKAGLDRVRKEEDEAAAAEEGDHSTQSCGASEGSNGDATAGDSTLSSPNFATRARRSTTFGNGGGDAADPSSPSSSRRLSIFSQTFRSRSALTVSSKNFIAAPPPTFTAERWNALVAEEEEEDAGGKHEEDAGNELKYCGRRDFFSATLKRYDEALERWKAIMILRGFMSRRTIVQNPTTEGAPADSGADAPTNKNWLQEGHSPSSPTNNAAQRREMRKAARRLVRQTANRALANSSSEDEDDANEKGDTNEAEAAVGTHGVKATYDNQIKDGVEGGGGGGGGDGFTRVTANTNGSAFAGGDAPHQTANTEANSPSAAAGVSAAAEMTMPAPSIALPSIDATAIGAFLLASLQGVYVWCTSLGMPLHYNEVFNKLFSFISIDFVATFPGLPAILTPILQIIFCGIIISGFVCLLLEDNRAFYNVMAKYMWRRDAAEMQQSDDSVEGPRERFLSSITQDIVEAGSGGGGDIGVERGGSLEYYVINPHTAFLLDVFRGEQKMPKKGKGDGDETSDEEEEEADAKEAAADGAHNSEESEEDNDTNSKDYAKKTHFTAEATIGDSFTFVRDDQSPSGVSVLPGEVSWSEIRKLQKERDALLAVREEEAAVKRSTADARSVEEAVRKATRGFVVGDNAAVVSAADDVAAVNEWSDAEENEHDDANAHVNADVKQKPLAPDSKHEGDAKNSQVNKKEDEEEEPSDDEPLTIGKPLKPVGVKCIHHPHIPLTPLLQTDLWPFDIRPKCCVAGCGATTGLMYSCGHEYDEEEDDDDNNDEGHEGGNNGGEKRKEGEGDAFDAFPPTTTRCVCVYALCQTHYRPSVKEDVISLVYSYVRLLKTNGIVWLLTAAAVAIANACYTPFIKTALMIVGCHPFYQCEFEDCWENINQKFALAAFLSIAGMLLLGVGFPLTLFLVLRSRSRAVFDTSLDPIHKGRYAEGSTAAKAPIKGGGGGRRRGEMFENEKAAATAPQRKQLSIAEWQRFIACDSTALVLTYKKLSLAWLYFPSLQLVFKAASLAPAVLLEPRTVDQRIGCAVVQCVITTIVFMTKPYGNPVMMLTLRLSELHLLIILALANLDLVYKNDRSDGGGGSASSSSDTTSTMTPVSRVMVATTVVYILFVAIVAVLVLLWPVISDFYRQKRLSAFLMRHGMTFSGTTVLYFDPSDNSSRQRVVVPPAKLSNNHNNTNGSPKAAFSKFFPPSKNLKARGSQNPFSSFSASQNASVGGFFVEANNDDDDGDHAAEYGESPTRSRKSTTFSSVSMMKNQLRMSHVAIPPPAVEQHVFAQEEEEGRHGGGADGKQPSHETNHEEKEEGGRHRRDSVAHSKSPLSKRRARHEEEEADADVAISAARNRRRTAGATSFVFATSEDVSLEAAE